MFARLAKTAALGAAALSSAGLLLAPTAASAQAYGYQAPPAAYGGQAYGQPYGYDRQDYGYDQRSGYDYCRDDRRQRQGAGLAVGATFGAVVGSQLGARGRRTEGSVLGAVIGGALGAAVGGDSARRCDSGHVQYGDDRGYDGYGGYDQGYDNRSYGQGYDDRGYGQGYDDRAAYADPYRAEDRYDDRGYNDRVYDDRGYDLRHDDRYRPDCRSVAVSSRDRYGRVVTRYQQTC